MQILNSARHNSVSGCSGMAHDILHYFKYNQISLSLYNQHITDRQTYEVTLGLAFSDFAAKVEKKQSSLAL